MPQVGALRLADNERLIEKQPVSAEAADWVIRCEDRTDYKTSVFRRVELLDSTGTVLLRKSCVKQAVPARMFYFGFDVQCGAGTIAGASFHVGRQEMKSGESSLQVEPTLLASIECTLPPCGEAVIERLRDEVKQTLDDPAASTAKLDMARQLLSLFFFDAKEKDYPLIARIVADDRVREIDQSLANVFSIQKTPPEMHVAYAKRILMDHSTAKLRYRLSGGTDELAAGNVCPSRCRSSGNLERSPNLPAGCSVPRMFGGPWSERATPALLAALEASLDLPHWHERRQIVGGVREGFIRLGRGASAAAPRIRELFLRRPSPIMNNAKQATEWRFALARMGVAISDLPYFPN